MRPSRRSLFCALPLIFSVAACAPSKPPVMTKAKTPAVKDGVRQEPLTADEALRLVETRRAQLEACYRREAANSKTLGAYLFKVSVPPDGTAPEVKIEKASVPGQQLLEDCLIQTLRAIPFPRHTGGAVLLELPIEYSRGAGPLTRRSLAARSMFATMTVPVLGETRFNDRGRG